ncbi:MAG: LuxR C-terminal-related transcriptional regulator [Nitrospinaceae bacterium]
MQTLSELKEAVVNLNEKTLALFPPGSLSPIESFLEKVPHFFPVGEPGGGSDPQPKGLDDLLSGLTAAEKDEPPGAAGGQWLSNFLLLYLQALVLKWAHREETLRYRLALDTLLEPGIGVAIVDQKLRVDFCNSTMEAEFNLHTAETLPPNLARLFPQRLAPGSRQMFGARALPGSDYNFFNWNNKNYKVSIRPLEVALSPSDQTYWILTIKPASDAFSRTNRLAQRVGLSWREVEICSLLHDGLDLDEISNRLFISKHTVKTYLKRIYRKCGVHSRSQLIALLNQYSTGKAGP